MTPEEEKSIEKWGQTLEHDLHIILVLTEDKRSEVFKNFTDSLTHICPKIRVKTEQSDATNAPEIRIDNIRYHAIPLDKELDPFLNLLSDREACSQQLPLSIRERVDQIRIPALLKIYITPQCPFCPATVRQLIFLASANDLIRLYIIDGFLFREMAEADNIRSAPTVLLDGQFLWSGSIQMSEMVDIILNRDASQLSTSSLLSMIEDGNATKIAEMMVNIGCIFPAFMELLVHEKWPVRLGAMVAFETVATMDNQLLLQVIPFLWERFSQVDDAVKGDILYLYGQSKNEKVVPKLKSVVMGPFSDDVKEAAAEALEALNVT